MEETEQKIRNYIFGDRIYNDKVKLTVDMVNSVLTAVVPQSLLKKTLSQAMSYNFKSINITTCD
jgi:hypothetical protein